MTSLSRKNVDPIRRALPFAEWPEQDQLAWTVAISRGGLFKDPGPAAHWRSATLKSYTFAHGRWLRFLTLRAPQDLAQNSVIRISHDRISEYVVLLHDQNLNPTTIWGYLSDLHNVVYNIYSDVDWSWLREIVNRLHLNVRPRPNLETQLVPIQDLYEAGLALIQQSESKRPRRPSCVHIDYRDGLMIVLMATTLLRIKNFADIEIGRHLIKSGNGYVMTFPAEEIKNKQYIELEVPDLVAPILERYLTYHRPALLDGQESAFLWISKEGHRMRDHHVSKRIVKVTMREIGKPISPHLFRHCAATSISETSPELTRIIQPLLVHTWATTGEKHYNRSSVLKASRRHSDVIEKLKAELAETDILETTS